MKSHFDWTFGCVVYLQTYSLSIDFYQNEVKCSAENLQSWYGTNVELNAWFWLRIWFFFGRGQAWLESLTIIPIVKHLFTSTLVVYCGNGSSKTYVTRMFDCCILPLARVLLYHCNLCHLPLAPGLCSFLYAFWFPRHKLHYILTIQTTLCSLR